MKYRCIDDLPEQYRAQAMQQMGKANVKKLSLDLPFPVSVNGMYRNAKKGRVLTTRTKKFYNAVANRVKDGRRDGSLPQGAMDGRLKLTLVLYMPDQRRRDVSNYVKSLEDALVKAGVMVDDQQVDVLTVYRHYIIPPGKVVVTLEAL